MTADQDSPHQSQPTRRVLSIEALLLNIPSSTHTSSDQLSLIKPLQSPHHEPHLSRGSYLLAITSTTHRTSQHLTRRSQRAIRNFGGAQRNIHQRGRSPVKLDRPRRPSGEKIRRSNRRRKGPTHLSHGLLKEHVLKNVFIDIVYFPLFRGV